MISLLSRLKNHRHRDGLVKKLAKTSPPPDAAGSKETPASLDSFFERVADAPPEAVLRENRRILQRTRALTNPQEREHVAAWVRHSVNERPPENLQAVESLLRSCRLHDLVGLLVSLSFLESPSTRIDHRALPAWASRPERRLHDTLFWCERVTTEQAEQMHAYFSSPTGKRWMVAVRDALEVALRDDPAVINPSVRRSPLARLLVPYVTSKRISDGIVNAAAQHLRDGDVEAAELFFFSSDCEGLVWLRALAENLEDMRRCFDNRRGRSRHKSF